MPSANSCREFIEMNPTPRILIYHRAAELYERLLRSALPASDFIATADESVFQQELPAAEVVVALDFPAAAAGNARKLRWIQGTGSGIEGLLAASRALTTVSLTNARGIHSDLMADYVFGGIMMMQWDFPSLMRAQAAREWRREPKRPLAGLTVGVIGLGPIGLEVARRASAFGMNVIGVTRSGRAVEGIDEICPASRVLDVLPRCDFVVLAVPTTEETRGMIGLNEIRAMKRDAVLINVSRGMVVDEPELITALQSRSIRGAVLDVFATEPLPQDSPLWSLSNVIITPHVSGMATTNEERFIELFVDNLGRYRAGAPLRNTIDIGRGY
jgi:phosphoglycerate dehydrogenase-like enzyme